MFFLYFKFLAGLEGGGFIILHLWTKIQLLVVLVHVRVVFVQFSFLHVPAIGSFSHWVFNAPNEQFVFRL
jgi:hypothetical protein